MVNPTGNYQMKRPVIKLFSRRTRPRPQARSFVTRHKKLVIVSAGLVVILVIAGVYIWWSLVAWSGVESRSMALRQSVSTHVGAALRLPVTSNDEKNKKLLALEAVNQEIASHQTVCDVSQFVVWQHAFEVFKKQEDACRAGLVRLNTLRTSLAAVIKYTRDEQTVARLIVAASSGAAESDEAAWQQTAVSWRGLAEKLKALQVSAPFKPVLTRIITEVEHVDASWQEVVAAHTAKDRARFEKAKDELSKAYGSLKDITQLSTDALMPLQKQLSSDYAHLHS